MIMRRKMKIFFVLGSLLTAMLLAGCQSASSPSDIKVIQVGAILPLDGAWSTTGQNAKVALDVALESVNAYLKKDNIQLKLVVENSGSDAAKALRAVKALHDRGVRAVVGPMTSDEAEAVVGYANANDMLIVSPSSTAASLALPDHLFRMVPNDNNQVEALTDLIKNQNITRVLPVYLDDAYGSSFEQLIRTRAGADGNGIEVLPSVKYEVSVTDFTPVVSSISAAAAALDPATTAILFIGRDSDAIRIFSGAGINSRLASFKWFATDSIIRETAILGSADAAAFAAKVQLEGFTFSSEATAPVVPTMMITGLMSAQLGTSASPVTLGVWDALWFVAEAYRRNPGADSAGLIENFKSVVNKGGNFSGETTKLDANGDMISTRYARFAVEEAGGVARWNLKGMFIKSISAGTLTLPATANFTQETTGKAVIGVLLPLSGADAESGSGALKAINLALEHAGDYYRYSAGVDIEFKIEVRDTASNPANALVQMQALHALGINLCIGPINSGELAAVQEYAKANGIVIISTTSTAPSLARSDDRILRLTSDDTNQAKALSRLITAQNKQHVVLIYRNDVYGQDLVTAFSAIYTGGVDSYGYEPGTTSFSSVLDQAASRVQAIGSPTDTAVLVGGLKEITSLLEQVKSGPLTEVKWYGTDGISQSRNLLQSAAAVAMAEKTQLTCSAYDMAALPYFSPAYQALESKLIPLLGGSSTWNEISAYDALWISASAFAMTRPAADSDELWTYLTHLFATTGIGEIYLFNAQSDQTVSLYAFYAVKAAAGGPAWTATAFYRDYYVARDNLEIIGQ
jgi:branched-chain amino acid transport system substrate-binding protein